MNPSWEHPGPTPAGNSKYSVNPSSQWSIFYNKYVVEDETSEIITHFFNECTKNDHCSEKQFDDIVSTGALASKFPFKIVSLADGHTEEAQSSVNPVQQSAVTAINDNKSTAVKFGVRNDTPSDIRHFPRGKNNWSEKHFVDILAICKKEQFSEDHCGEA